MSVLKEIPLSKLVPSAANVRKTGGEVGLEELAASIAAHGLLQNLPVRSVLNEAGAETGKFEVVAGGRRFAALKLLAKRKRIAKGAPVACNVLVDGDPVEISLAENVTQLPMHPADQYEAFERLRREQGLTADDIAARFGLTAAAVRQRMKLGAVSPALMQVYRDGDMNLEQLMAFIITRDLFDEAHGGFFADPELLDRLVREKLEAEAQEMAAEGWKWVVVAPEFNYTLAVGMRRVYPSPVPLTGEEQARLDALEAEYETLSVQHDGEAATPEIEAEFDRIDAEIEKLRDRQVYGPDDVASAGAFVALGYDGATRIERGYVRPEDEPAEPEPVDGEAHGATDLPAHAGDEPDVGESEADPAEDEDDGHAALSDRLIEELTYHKTAALQDHLADNPDVALAAVVHALAVPVFYGRGYNPVTCLKIEASPLEFGSGIGQGRAAQAVMDRLGQWAAKLPRTSGDLWDWISTQDRETLLSLLAYCAGRTVFAVLQPWNREPKRLAHAESLAQAVELDMTAYWRPTVSTYFGRVTKAAILEAVREAVSSDAADNMARMKKQEMAEGAEILLAGTGWLPAILRTSPKPELERTPDNAVESETIEADSDHPALAAE